MEPANIVDEYSKPSAYRTRRELRKELVSYNLDDRLIEKANSIYYQLSTSRYSNMPTIIIRADNRQLLLFYCIYYAYLELDVIVEPYTLAAELGFPPKVVKQSFKCFTTPVYGYYPDVYIFKIAQLAPPMIKFFRLANVYARIVYKLATYLDDELEKLNCESKKPQRWVLTLIYFCSIWASQYLRITNDFDLEQACAILDIRASTIKSHTRQIERHSSIHQQMREIVNNELSKYFEE